MAGQITPTRQPSAKPDLPGSPAPSRFQILHWFPSQLTSIQTAGRVWSKLPKKRGVEGSSGTNSTASLPSPGTETVLALLRYMDLPSHPTSTELLAWFQWTDVKA
ncbi:hypothetical protein CIHG_08294 [Coccidioides immitis H538.4]|uniref:Uncharacterized protein n=3 Tax=Coccidioides immitis TaxID=5501 RepID=A0A0J8QPS1_COCIT|nr:hypothetical protein CIRG_02291 [Coccidioides immitis RMSCC 2394]KMU74524.1 hypothetical protein CISG_04231 [Coccidioides immitis RMSCC 3703]KMU90578.1 hypothetical protein CIHG_08294 [Coccidioides immitis H538.4]